MGRSGNANGPKTLAEPHLKPYVFGKGAYIGLGAPSIWVREIALPPRCLPPNRSMGRSKSI